MVMLQLQEQVLNENKAFAILKVCLAAAADPVDIRRRSGTDQVSAQSKAGCELYGW